MRRLPVLPLDPSPETGSRSAVHAALPGVPDGFAADGPPLLRDGMGRQYTYLRLSVTDRCDLACHYCMPPGGEDDHALRPELLTFEEAARLVRVFAAGGIRRVRFTGGEPLVRKDFVRLVELVRRQTGVESLVMTSNATRLGELALPLRDAGLTGVNISLDSLDRERFRRITRGGDLGRVLAGIHASLEAGFEVKMNIVALGGENDDELGRLVDFAWDLGITPRFIELMPLGEGANLPRETFLSAADIIERLAGRLAVGELRGTGALDRGPARYHEAADGSGRRVGFITAVSDTFCDTCNRVRVTARGDIRACLASRRAVSLRDLMREGASDRDLAWAMHWSLGAKDDGHHFLDDVIREHENVGMSLIGG